MRFTIVPLTLALTALAAGAHAANLEVSIDHALRLPVHGAGSVVLGNPAVADVTVVDSNTVYVLGRSYGSTDVVVLDRAGRAVFSSNITVTQPGSDVAVYRGAERTEYACASSCARSARGQSGSTGSTGASAGTGAGLTAPTPTAH